MLEEGLVLLQDEISDMFREDYFTPDGISGAVEQLRRDRLFKQESSLDMATETLPFWWVQGAGLDYYLSYPENLAGVTSEDVRLFIAEWILNKPSAVFLVSPEGEWSE
jgi:predicted Zn-dependent peptidase